MVDITIVNGGYNSLITSGKLTVRPWQLSGLEDECFHYKLVIFRVYVYLPQGKSPNGDRFYIYLGVSSLFRGLFPNGHPIPLGGQNR